MQIFVTVDKKVLSLGSCCCYGGPGGPYVLSRFTKNTCFGTTCNDENTGNDAKGIITFNPTYLTKVTTISGILKFLNTVFKYYPIIFKQKKLIFKLPPSVNSRLHACLWVCRTEEKFCPKIFYFVF